MKRTDRLTEIKKVVAKQGRIELTELSQLFGVSVVTIRKDVEILQERNSVRRVHGAVVALEEPELQEEEKDSIMGIPLVNVALKEKIGKIAASRVNGSGWIFIGQGTTCYYVAKELAKQVSSVAPLLGKGLGPTCMTDLVCYEGKECCGLINSLLENRTVEKIK